jgi:hypothetical protein
MSAFTAADYLAASVGPVDLAIAKAALKRQETASSLANAQSIRGKEHQ